MEGEGQDVEMSPATGLLSVPECVLGGIDRVAAGGCAGDWAEWCWNAAQSAFLCFDLPALDFGVSGKS